MKPIDEDTLLKLVTAAVREADDSFEKTGGSSRHWARWG
jgi:DNA-binding protein YbaB